MFSEIIIKQEMKELFNRFATDAIATSVFGIEIDSLIDRENDFFLMGKDLTDISSGLRPLKFLLALSSPFIFKVCIYKRIRRNTVTHRIRAFCAWVLLNFSTEMSSSHAQYSRLRCNCIKSNTLEVITVEIFYYSPPSPLVQQTQCHSFFS